MLLASILKRVLPFSASLVLGLVVSLGWIDATQKVIGIEELPMVEGDGSGFAACINNTEKFYPIKPVGSNLKIISKPRPEYTEEARENNVQGKVVLEVAFLASGSIGLVKPLTTLPHGLTEKASEAAKQIQFEPPRVDGRPNSVIKKVEYTFAIY